VAFGVKLKSSDDALQVIYSGLPACIFRPEDLAADFFDLQSGLAGEVFQKFVNYKYQMAISMVIELL
jgi:Domain of unknown function (DUF4180)